MGERPKAISELLLYHQRLLDVVVKLEKFVRELQAEVLFLHQMLEEHGLEEGFDARRNSAASSTDDR